MRIKHVEIENFRSIRHAALDFGETTVFIGPNNAGKTAILDAVRIALPYHREQRWKKFRPFHYYCDRTRKFREIWNKAIVN